MDLIQFQYFVETEMAWNLRWMVRRLENQFSDLEIQSLSVGQMTPLGAMAVFWTLSVNFNGKHTCCTERS